MYRVVSPSKPQCTTVYCCRSVVYRVVSPSKPHCTVVYCCRSVVYSVVSPNLTAQRFTDFSVACPQRCKCHSSVKPHCRTWIHCQFMSVYAVSHFTAEHGFIVSGRVSVFSVTPHCRTWIHCQFMSVAVSVYAVSHLTAELGFIVSSCQWPCQCMQSQASLQTDSLTVDSLTVVSVVHPNSKSVLVYDILP